MSEGLSLADHADDFFDDDVPWADAGIRRRYEAALGAYILAFNQLDNLLGKILRTILVRLGRPELISELVDNAMFKQRVSTFDLLKLSVEGNAIAGIP